MGSSVRSSARFVSLLGANYQTAGSARPASQGATSDIPVFCRLHWPRSNNPADSPMRVVHDIELTPTVDDFEQQQPAVAGWVRLEPGPVNALPIAATVLLIDGHGIAPLR
ncbi:MAG: hypothetical protein MJE77_27345 [Proteobacteria bacterium]|nr:hypothetical protein [Pseudomonadota bacterium]